MDITIAPASSVQGIADVPGDKAISHRALILGALAEPRPALIGLSPAADVSATASALLAAGFPLPVVHQPGLEGSSSGRAVISFQKLGDLDPANHAPVTIDCANSGTTLRMMTGLLSGVPAMEADLIGDSSLMRRPMLRVAEPLRLMGAEISLSSEGTAPVRISGRTLEGIEYRLPVASAQVKTALILAGLHAEGRTIIEEPQRSRDHTERLMAFLGVDVTRGELRYEVTAAKLVGDRSIDIPRDFSSAAFVICAAALLPGSDVTILGCGLNPTRTAFLDILRRFGAEVEMDDVREVSGEPRGALRVRYAGTRAVRVGSSEVPGAIDELPLVAVLGTAAEGETTVEGAGELRVKESDRIRAIAEGLRRMGGDVREEADGFTVVGPTRLHGAHVDAGGDHRIAMALAVAGLAAEGETVIHGWEAADVSFPRFAEALQAVTVR